MYGLLSARVSVEDKDEYVEKEITWLSFAVPASSILLGALVSYFSISFIESKKVKWARKRAKEDFYKELDFFTVFLKKQLNNSIRSVLSLRVEGDDLDLFEHPDFTDFDNRIIMDFYSRCARDLNYATRVAFMATINKAEKLSARNKQADAFHQRLFDDKFIEADYRAAVANKLRASVRHISLHYSVIKTIAKRKDDHDSSFSHGPEFISKYMKKYNKSDIEIKFVIDNDDIDEYQFDSLN